MRKPAGRQGICYGLLCAAIFSGGRRIISQLVCNESAKLSAEAVAAANDVSLVNVFVTVLFTLE